MQDDKAKIRKLEHQLRVANEKIALLRRLPGAERIRLKRSPYSCGG